MFPLLLSSSYLPPLFPSLKSVDMMTTPATQTGTNSCGDSRAYLRALLQVLPALTMAEEDGKGKMKNECEMRTIHDLSMHLGRLKSQRARSTYDAILSTCAHVHKIKMDV